MSYKLDKLIGINFANLKKREFSFQGSLTLLVGENGSGKSTLQDMIQIGMTADINNIINYNAGQSEDDTKKRNERRRSFASYLLGADQLKFTRTDAIGVIALVFKNSINGKKFTAWIYGEAEAEGNKTLQNAKGGVEKLGFCFDTELCANDFMENENQKGNIKDFQKLNRYLKSKHKEKYVECTSKREYLTKLYSSFNGLNSMPYPDAFKAAKAFVKYIFPTKADNINKFVSKELLEDIDLSSTIQGLRESILKFNTIEQEARDIGISETSLEKLLKLGDQTLEQWKGHFDEGYIFRKREEIRVLKTIDKSKKELFKLNKEMDKKRKEFENIKSELPSLRATIVSLNSNLEGNEKITLKRKLEDEVEELKLKKDEALVDLRSEFKTFENIYLYLQNMEDIFDIKEFIDDDVLQRLKEVNRNDSLTFEEKLSMYVDLSQELTIILEDSNSFMTAFEKRKNELYNNYDETNKEAEKLFKEINAFELTGKATYPIQTDLNVVRENYPEANATPLCELLDIKDENWRRSIEGFLGWNRFAIVVDGNYEVSVTNLLKDRNLKSKVIQGNKVLYDQERFAREVKPDSIINLMRFNSPIAEAYMILNYGNVMQVKTTEQLTKSVRGLKSDGLAASGYTTFECLAKRSECYIGEASKIERYNSLKESYKEKANMILPYKSKFDKAEELMKKLTRTSFGNIKSMINNSDSVENEIRILEGNINDIDISEEEEALKRIVELNSTIEEKESLRDLISSDIGSLISEIGRKEVDIGNTQSIHEGNKKIILERANDIRVVYHDTLIDIGTKIEEMDEIANSTYTDSSPSSSFENGVKKSAFMYEQESNEHNSKCVEIASVPLANFYFNLDDSLESYKKLKNYYFEQDDVYTRIKNNLLKKKQKELAEAKDVFDRSFKGEFCKIIYNSISEGTQKVRSLNLMLKKHKFGNEKFTIKEPFIQKYKEYYEYFEYIVMSNSDGLGYDAEDIPEELLETKENVEKLLLDSDNLDSSKELENISDYRNYKAYDIHKVFDENEEESISLNELATDSGGQATTSYYIIRSIAAYSAFDKENKSYKTGGLGFLLIDEAFNRVDDGRTGDMIKYLKDSLGFQIIAATPTKDESVLKPYATDRYSLFKTINSTPNTYEVNQYAEYTELNQEEIQKLLAREAAKIRQEFSLFDT